MASLRILVALAVAILAAAPVFAQTGPSMRERPYDSLLGRDVLSRSDSLFRGRVESTHMLGRGILVARIRVLEVLDGADPGSEASVSAADPDQFPATGVEVLVFGSRGESRSLFHSVGHFFVEDDLGKIKLALVRRILEIERMPRSEDRIAELRKLAIQNLGDPDPWLAWNAAQEIFHLVFVLKLDLAPKERDRISDLTIQSNDDRFAAYLQTILLGLRSRSPGPEAPRAPSGSLVEPPPAAPERPGSPAHLRRLAQAFLDATDGEAARRILLELSPHRVAIVDQILVRSLSHHAEEVRAQAATLLGARDTRVAVGPLVAALDADRSLRVRASSAASLGRLGGDEALDALVRHLEDRALRRDCLAAVGAIGSPRARAILEEALGRLAPGPSPERALIEDLLQS